MNSEIAQEVRRVHLTKKQTNRRGGWTDDEATDLKDDNETLKVIRPVKPLQTDALDYRTCRLVNRDSTYDD